MSFVSEFVIRVAGESLQLDSLNSTDVFGFVSSILCLFDKQRSTMMLTQTFKMYFCFFFRCIMFQAQILNSASIFQKYGCAMLLQTQNAAVA